MHPLLQSKNSQHIVVKATQGTIYCVFGCNQPLKKCSKTLKNVMKRKKMMKKGKKKEQKVAIPAGFQMEFRDESVTTVIPTKAGIQCFLYVPKFHVETRTPHFLMQRAGLGMPGFTIIIRQDWKGCTRRIKDLGCMVIRTDAQSHLFGLCNGNASAVSAASPV